MARVVIRAILKLSPTQRREQRQRRTPSRRLFTWLPRNLRNPRRGVTADYQSRAIRERAGLAWRDRIACPIYDTDRGKNHEQMMDGTRVHRTSRIPSSREVYREILVAFSLEFLSFLPELLIRRPRGFSSGRESWPDRIYRRIALWIIHCRVVSLGAKNMIRGINGS